MIPITFSATGGYADVISTPAFNTNRFHLFELEYDGETASFNGSDPTMLEADIDEGASIEVTVEFSNSSSLASSAPITVSIEPADGADERAQVIGSDTVVLSLPSGSETRTSRTFDIAVSETGALAGEAEFEVRILSSDGAYIARNGGMVLPDFSLSPSNPLVLRLAISPGHGIASSSGDTITVPPGGSSEYSFSLNRPPSSGMVTVGLDLVPTDSLPDGVELALEPMDPELVFGTADWDQEQSVRVVQSFTGDDTSLDEEIGFELRITMGSSTDSDFDGLDITVSGAVRESYEGTDLHLGQALGTQAVGLGQFALDVIGGQIGGGAQGIALSGAAADPHSPGDAWASGEDGWRTDFASLIGSGTGFSLPLGHDGSGRIWARAGYSSHSGTSQGLQPAEYDGDLFGVMYGIDRDYGIHTYGVAVSHMGSDTDFVGAGSLASADQTMLGLHPYYGLRMGGGNRLWVVGSYGWGELGAGLDDGSVIDTDTEFKAVAVGLEHAMDAGGIDVAIRLAGIFGDHSLDASEGYTAAGLVSQDGSPVSSDFSRLRAEIELGMPYETTEGRLLHPYVLVAVRLDGGDLSDDGAVEIGGGVRATVNSAYEIDVSARVQATGGDHREHSASGSISYDRGADGRGLVGSVSQEYEEGSLGTKGRIGYRWGARLLGQSGFAGPTLSYSSGNDGIITQLGFFSPRLRLMVEGGSEETLARMDVNLYSFI